MYNYFWFFIIFLSLSSDLLAFEFFSDVEKNDNVRVKTHYGIGYEQRKALLMTQEKGITPKKVQLIRAISRIQKIDRPIRPYRPQRPIRPGR